MEDVSSYYPVFADQNSSNKNRVLVLIKMQHRALQRAFAFTILFDLERRNKHCYKNFHSLYKEMGALKEVDPKVLLLIPNIIGGGNIPSQRRQTLKKHTVPGAF